MGSLAADSQDSLLERTRSAFAGKRVLVTGHTGFKGSWLSAWLNTLGATVAGIALAPDAGQRDLFTLTSRIVDFTPSTIGDIRDAPLVSKCVNDFAPDVVFHLAAQPLVRLSYEEPVETYDVNVRGTAELLDAVRLSETPVVVCVTTDKCYENTEQIWPYREDDPVGGWDPYSASKGAAELVVQSFRRSFFPTDGPTACATARGGNVIGGGDLSADRLVPDVYRAMTTGEAVALRRPQATRPWQHVLESLSGYLTLATALIESGTEFAEAWNFGPDTSERVNVGDFVAALVKKLGPDAPQIELGQSGPHEANLLSLDITKAAVRLGWKPVLSIEERITATADWMSAQRVGALDANLLLNQISWFEGKWHSG